MDRTKILLIIFFLIGIVFGYWAVTQLGKGEDYSTLTADREFAPDNIEEVTRVFIADRNGNISDLRKQGNQWIYNEKYPASPNVIENLLDAVERIKVKYKPANAAVPDMVQNLATEGIKVELYNSSNRLLKIYYIGGSTIDERATYAILEGEDQPYVTHIPGWEGNLRYRFNLTGDDWRDKTLLKYKVEDIQEVSIQYPKQTDLSFRLTQKDDVYDVTPFNEAGLKKSSSPDQSKVEAYLMGFNQIIAEAFENDNPIQDSILQLVPFSIISVKDKAGKTRTIKLFPIILDGEGIDPKSGLRLGQQEVERYFLEVDNQDFMLGQNRLLKEILWAYDYFF